MLRPFILALCLGLLPLAAAQAQGADGAGQGADLSENAYRRDVATGARLAVEDAELTMKFNAGKISAAHYDAAEARVRKQSAALLDKWAHGVNRRASVMFSGDVWVKSRDEIICSGAQSKCGGRAIEGGFRRRLAETGGCVRRTLFENGRTLGETDARSSVLAQNA